MFPAQPVTTGSGMILPMLPTCRIFLVLLAVSSAFAQSLVGPQVSSISFPTIASPVLYGLGSAISAGGFICTGDCGVQYYPARSSDNGVTWLPLYVFPAGTAQNVTGIAVDPTNPDVVYVSAQMNRGGIWKSVDGGQTWTSRVAGLPAGAATVDSLVVAANNSQVLYMVVAGGLYKSTDGAATWVLQANLPGGRNGKMGLLPKTPSEGYYVTRGGAAFRSTDDGKTWNSAGQITVQGGLIESNAVPQCVTVDPSNTNIAYICLGVDAGSGFTGIWGFWRTANTGSTWSMAYATPQTNAANGVFVDPRGGNIVHLAVGFFGRPYARSVDKGVTFTDMTTISPIGIDPRTPDVVWSYTGSYLSRDAGLTGASLGSTFRPTFLRVTDPIVIQLEQGLSTTQTIPVTTAERIVVNVTGTVSGASWLTVPTQTATVQTGLKINISSSGLKQGTYDGSVTLSSTQTLGGGSVPIRLIVTAPVPPGPVYTATAIAGGGSGEQWPSTGAALGANLLLMDQVAVDPSGRIYVSGTRRVRRIESTGGLTAIAGNGQFTASGSTVNGDGGPATDATFGVYVSGIAVDAQNRVFLSDGNSNRLRVVENGVIRTLFGPTDTVAGSGLSGPQGMQFASNGDLWLACFNGIVRIPAGLTRMEMFFARPSGASFVDIAVTPDGTLYFTDQGRSLLFRVSPNGPATVIAGTGVAGFNGDGIGDEVQLNRPTGLAVDAQGNVWFADTGNSRVRVVGKDGYVRTVAGGGPSSGLSGVGALDISLSLPNDVTIDAQGNALITESSRLYRLTKDTIPRPRAVSGSFVNAGSNLVKLSPGALFSFYGANMATSTDVASGSPWPTTLGGATVKINGTAVPLFYASPTQINGQVPYELTIGSTGTAMVTANGLNSGNVTFTVSASSPGILVFGDNRAVVVNANGAVNTAATPAKPGEVAVAYFVGTGLLDNAVATGKAAPRDPLSRPNLPYKIFLGQTECQVLFLGLTPDYIGLAQANFTLPDLPPGDYPLTIAIGNEVSNGPVITIGPK
jgi:uncharacterized protein (TIGR03437 family)